MFEVSTGKEIKLLNGKTLGFDNESDIVLNSYRSYERVYRDNNLNENVNYYGYYNTLRIYNLISGQVTHKFYFNDRVDQAIFIDNNKTILVSTSDSVFTFDIEKGSKVINFERVIDKKILSYDEKTIISVNITPNRKEILLGYIDRSEILFNILDGRIKSEFIGKVIGVKSSLSPNGKLLLISDEEQKEYIYDFFTGKEILKFSNEKKSFASFDFSPDGNSVLLRGPYGVQIYNLSKISEPIVIAGYPIRNASFSYDGKNVATVNYDEKVSFLNQLQAKNY